MPVKAVTSSAGEAQENTEAMFLAGRVLQPPTWSRRVRTRRLGSISLLSCQGPGLGQSAEPAASYYLWAPGSVRGPSCSGTGRRERRFLSRNHQPARRSPHGTGTGTGVGDRQAAFPPPAFSNQGVGVCWEHAAFHPASAALPLLLLRTPAPSPARGSPAPIQKAGDLSVTSYCAGTAPEANLCTSPPARQRCRSFRPQTSLRPPAPGAQ